MLVLFLLVLDLLSSRAAPPVPSSIPDPLLEYVPPEKELVDGWIQSRNRTGTRTTGLEGCGPCNPELCPQTRGCRAGLVLDSCGCCQECGNLEGQACDPGPLNVFYGLCGTGLRCQADPGPAAGGEDEEEVCVCEQQEALCGSDGTTYRNMCRFREAAFSDPELRTVGRGPCRTGTDT